MADLPDYLSPESPEWRKYVEEWRVTQPELATRFERLQDPIANLNQTSLDDLSATITTGLNRGYSALQIAEGVADERFVGIQGQFNYFEDWRSEMIARTEGREAFNSGGLQSYADASVDQVEAIDGDYDEECRIRNGERFDFDPANGSILADASELEEHPNGGLTWAPMGSQQSLLRGMAEQDKIEQGLVGAVEDAAAQVAANELPQWAKWVGESRDAIQSEGGFLPMTDANGKVLESAYTKPGEGISNPGWIRASDEPSSRAFAQLDHITTAGQAIEAEINRRTDGFFVKFDSATEKLQAGQKKSAAAIEKMTKLVRLQKTMTPADWDTQIRGQYIAAKDAVAKVTTENSRLAKELNDLRNANPSQEIKDVLGELRPMGGDLRVREWEEGRLVEAESERLTDAATAYPQDWIEGSNADAIPLRIAQATGDLAERGYYVPSSGAIVIPEDSKTIALHELAHRLEHTNLPVTKSEWLFWHSRTGGEATKPLSELIPGSGYNEAERARLDAFSDAYMGKTYGDNPNSAYELMSMGMENLMGGKYHIDKEYRRWLLGTLGLL